MHTVSYKPGYVEELEARCERLARVVRAHRAYVAASLASSDKRESDAEWRAFKRADADLLPIDLDRPPVERGA